MSNVLIGIDLGTTYLKAAAFDARTGAALASCGERLRVHTGSTGQREQSPVELQKALDRIMATLRKRAGRSWSSVAGLGLAAQGGSTCIVDRETGRAHMPMILWNDTRAFEYYPRVKKNRPASYWRRHTMRDDPGMGLARLLWLRETRPGLLKSSNIYSGAGEFFYFLLTGVWRQDAGNALQTGCYNAVRKDIDPELLTIAGVKPDFVAPMRQGHELHQLSRRAAKRYGLREGIPVAGPYMDHEAGYLSAAGAARHPLQMSLGTAWVGNVMLDAADKWTSPYQLVLPGITGPGWLVVQPLLTGNIVLDWALETFVHGEHERAIAALPGIFANDLLPPEGLTAFPWLNRPNPFLPGVLGAGMFSGLNLGVQRSDLYKALAASLTFEMERVFEGVRTARRAGCVVVGGGASKGGFFVQLLSALFHPLPVLTYEDGDLSGARGVLYALSRNVAKARTRRAAVVPAALRDRVRKRYDEYIRLMSETYGTCPAGGGLVFRSPR